MALFDFLKRKKDGGLVGSGETPKKPTNSANSSGAATTQLGPPQNSSSDLDKNIDIPVQMQPNNNPNGVVPRTIIVPSEDGNKKTASKATETIKHIKLRIFLIENIKNMETEITKISKIFNRFLDSSFIVINYGSIVRVSSIMESSDFKIENLLITEDLGDNSCLYNALTELGNIVEEYYNKLKQEDDKTICVNAIEIIGIGTGADNFSTVSENLGRESVAKSAKLNNVTTRYFCLDEQYVVNAAVIGFRSIGTIPKTKV